MRSIALLVRVSYRGRYLSTRKYQLIARITSLVSRKACELRLRDLQYLRGLYPRAGWKSVAVSFLKGLKCHVTPGTFTETRLFLARMLSHFLQKDGSMMSRQNGIRSSTSGLDMGGEPVLGKTSRTWSCLKPLCNFSGALTSSWQTTSKTPRSILSREVFVTLRIYGLLLRREALANWAGLICYDIVYYTCILLEQNERLHSPCSLYGPREC